jgi:hypothetical protein
MSGSTTLPAASARRSGLLLTTSGGLLLGTLGVFLLEAG